LKMQGAIPAIDKPIHAILPKQKKRREGLHGQLPKKTGIKIIAKQEQSLGT